ncbi:tail fiber domain-containing protein [Longimicrobium sp.]|uniref:tail fiber domain-containing protein n=1 Tax=Longimicrobium sp. TaxID=2029185 RepID=UPI002B7F9188|nr:tail fiber domain-containing protein [Longimicrobium sp.]HSU15784.1 tail fiber domain-containing protein [Longimicrobium sp.]
MRNRLLIATLAAGALAAAAPAPAAAQIDSIRACYVPTTGNVYRIGTPDTHATCVAASHVRFAWPATSPDLGIGGRYLLRLRSGSPISNRFFVDSAGGVAALGTLGIGDIPQSGAGLRMMWHPYKAAFRAGGVDINQWDDPYIGFYSWAGGNNTRAEGYGAFAFGDGAVVTSVLGVGFGSNVNVSGTIGFVAGASNRCGGFACVAMGFTNTADGQGSVALGYRTTADADYSMALGYRASVNGHSGSFVRGDASTTDSLLSVVNNEFAVRAAGGFRFRTNATLTTGCNLPAGSGVFSCSSSRTLKDHFGVVDGEELLERIRGVPVGTWSYIAEGAQVRHMGPFAEDFRAAFGLGTDNRAIGLLDIDGVNFAAVKALEARTAELRVKAAEVDRLTAEVAALRDRQAATDARLAELEALVGRMSQR